MGTGFTIIFSNPFCYMSKKRTTSVKKSKPAEKAPEHKPKSKKPLKSYTTTPNRRSLSKSHQKVIKQSKPKPRSTSKKSVENSNKQRKKSSPNKSSSGKKHGRSRDYDSPSKDHEDFHHFLIQPQGKSTKRDIHPDVQALLNLAKQLLKGNQPIEAIEVLEKAAKKQDAYEVNYLLGVCYIITEQYANSIAIFKNLLKFEKKPKKNIYLLLSVCYKKMEDFVNTEKILNICLQKYPKFYEAYVYRGKLYVKTKRYKEANTDFQTAIQLQPEKQIGYVGKGDCDRSIQKYQSAIQFYNVALRIQPSPNVLLRRAICNLQIKRYELAMSDIDVLLKNDPENSEAMYFKGLIYNKKDNNNEAIICYEQAIKFNTNKKAVTRSIYEITKIKIQQKDFYEAFYTLERAQYLDIDIKSLNKFKIFTDGVTHLMKKNYQKGIEILNELIKEHTLTKFLKPLFLSARSYGMMALERFQDARSDLVRLQKQFSLDPPNLYNKFLCEGIISCNSHKYEQALAYFSKAGKTRPQRLQPNFYKAVALIRFASKLIPKDMADKKLDYLQSAMKTINKVETLPKDNPSLFLLRGLLKFSLGQVKQALIDFQQSMNESAAAFYLKGLAQATLGRISDSIHQFNIAADRDQKHQYPEIYLNRAKCTLLLGQANKAFCDLQTYMTFRPSSPDIHIWAGHLLFCIGAYTDAAKAYSNINNIQKNPKVLLQRAKCFLASKDVSAACHDLKAMLDVQQDARTKFDYAMLQAFQMCSEGQEYFHQALEMMRSAKLQSGLFGKIFRQSDYKYYKGVINFYLGDYEKAIGKFEKALKMKQGQLTSQGLLGEFDEPHLYKLDFVNSGTFNIYEYHYNLAICHILNGNLAKGLKSLKNTVQKMQSGKMRQEVQVFIHYISNQMKNALTFSKKPPKQQQPQQQQADFFPFPFENRLCSIFPESILPLSSKIRTRIYFCLPYITKPDITPRFDEKLLQQVDMRWIEMKPEAPWIRRTEQGIVFTDEVVNYDIELSESSDEGEERTEHAGEEEGEGHGMHQREYQREERYRENLSEEEKDQDIGNVAMYRDEYEEEEEEVRETKPDPKKMKDLLKLDKGTEQRLAKLCKK